MSILWHITSLLLLRSCAPGFFIHGIVGGKVSVPHSRPYMVYIHDKVSKKSCGGFLLREDFVMTAAQCKQSHLLVYLEVNDSNLLPDGVEVDPFPHPEFKRKRTGHDIMLLKLKTPATSNKTVSTITLQISENEEISKDCMVMGWGWKKYHHKSPSNVLKEANVTLKTVARLILCAVRDQLDQQWYFKMHRTEITYDVSVSVQSDILTIKYYLQGDSGGPLVCGGVAQGIVSFSKSKTNATYLIGYTNISHYLPWINDTMTSKISDQVSTPGTLDVTPDAKHQNLINGKSCLVPKSVAY